MNVQEAAGAAIAVCDRMSGRVESLRNALARIGRDRRLSRSLLIVEDDPVMREYLAEILAGSLDVPVSAVADARSAREAWAEERHGALLVDLHLGAGPSGAELIEALPRGPKVALYTGNVDSLSDDLRDAARAIDARVIPKPARPSEIVALLRELLDDAAPVVM